MDLDPKCGYKVKEKIGGGTYGSVYQVISRNGSLYALKRGNILPSEIDIMSRLVHPHLMSIIEIIGPRKCDVHQLMFIMPLASGNLYTLMTNSWSKKSQLPPLVRLKILYQLSTGVQYLHEKKILHLDLKLENIVYHGKPSNPTSVVTDMGLAYYVNNVKIGRYIDQILVNNLYRPPEILAGSRIYNGAVDVWSMGILFLEMLVSLRRNVYPFKTSKEMTDENILAYEREYFTDDTRESWIRSFLLEGGLQRDLIEEAVDLLDQMLAFNPRQRPTVDQVLNHPLFSTHGLIDRPRGSVKNVPQIALTSIPKLYIDGVMWLLQILKDEPLFATMPVEVLFLAMDLYQRGLCSLDLKTELCQREILTPFQVILLASASIFLARQLYYHPYETFNPEKYFKVFSSLIMCRKDVLL